MNAYTPNLYRAIRRYAGKVRSMHEDFRMAHFMYSLPEEVRKDIGWPDFSGERVTRGR
jgi:hypothetical protein